jgi:type IV secretion system protein VirB11
VWSIEDLAARGIFRRTRRADKQLDATELELQRLLDTGDYPSFMRLAVVSRKNILVSGPTGSGKTTWTKALIREIPNHERLVTIEDAQELVLDRHPNAVRLFYSKDDQGVARVTPKQLLESCLRMKPDRILLAELRAEEAFDYLRNVNSGHPGSITSVHAASAELAFEQLVLLVKQNQGGRDLARADIKSLLYLLIDVVIQFGVESHERFIKEIWFEPRHKHAATSASGSA